MRPKGKIGIYTKSPTEMSVWRIILRTRRYPVEATDGHRAAYVSACTDDLRCMLIVRTDRQDKSEKLSQDICALRGVFRPKVIFVDRIDSAMNTQTDLYFGPHSQAADVIAGIKLLEPRKRGPKKKPAIGVVVMEANQCQAM